MNNHKERLVLRSRIKKRIELCFNTEVDDDFKKAYYQQEYMDSR